MPRKATTYPPSSTEIDRLSLEEKLDTVSTYVTAVLNEDTRTSSMWERPAYLVFHRPSTLTGEVFLPLLQMIPDSETDEWTRSVIPRLSLVVTMALQHPDCLPALLAKACRGPSRTYATTAAQHPNCPEEDAVYSALNHR